MKTEDEVMALRRRVLAERRAAGAGPVRYSAELRRDFLSLLDRSDWSQARLSSAVGVASSVIHHWKGHKGPRGPAGQLRKMQVVASAPAATEIEIEFPCGAKVRGLTLEQVAKLLEVKA